MRYRKKPIEVEAFQFGREEHPLWFMEAVFKGDILIDPYVESYDEVYTCRIKTLEGTMIANKGDMIIQGVIGEIYPCKNDIFDKSYDLVKK